jgi:hypothetical protein
VTNEDFSKSTLFKCIEGCFFEVFELFERAVTW